MPDAIGSKGKDRSLRTPDDPDPIHEKPFTYYGPVDGAGGINLSGPYEPVIGWPLPNHDDGQFKTGSGRTVIAESPDRVFAIHGGEVPAYSKTGVWGQKIFIDLGFTQVHAEKIGGRHCHEIMVYDRSGKAIECWDQWLDEIMANHRKDGKEPDLGHINRLRVDPKDPERHMWVVGSGNTGIYKFTNDGKKLVLKIDAMSLPEEYRPYVYAQDIAFLPNGDFIIGHVHYIFRFNKDGEFLSAIGKPGKGPGEFDGIHGIEVHPENGKIYINDRINQRIQVLDYDLNFVEAWGGFVGVYAIRLTADGKYLWTSNGYTAKFVKYDLNGGKLIPEATWGTFGIAPGSIWGPHYFETDSEGNLYVAEDYSGRVQKFRLMDGIDPKHPQIIGPLFR